MMPTLQLQDRILVEKIRPAILQSQHRHLVTGNIVVFSPPQSLVQAGYDPKAALIKRVVGQPGDRIEVHNGRLLRNGVLIEESWLAEPIAYDMSSVTVPQDQLWVMGDNRNSSLDSHIWGPLPEQNVIGTAVWRYWPLRRFGPIRVPDQQKGRTDPDPAVRSGP